MSLKNSTSKEILVIYSTHLVGLLVHGLHHNHVSGLVDPVDWRLQLHSVSQLPRHALTHLIRTSYKLPLLETQREQSSVSTNRESRCSNTGFYLYWVEVTLIPLWVPLGKANKLPVWNEADKITFIKPGQQMLNDEDDSEEVERFGLSKLRYTKPFPCG